MTGTSATDFNIYLNWLYHRQVFIDVNKDETRQGGYVLPRFVAAYTLGELLKDIDFMDALNDIFVVSFSTPENGQNYFPNKMYRKLLYEQTSEGSMARKILVHKLARSLKAKDLYNEEHPAFLLDLAREQCAKDSESTVTAAARCAFHQHAPGEQDCYRKKHALTAWKRLV